MSKLHANIDIHGNAIDVGIHVRSHDDAKFSRDVEGPDAFYMEGVVDAIGPVEGFADCDRYTLRVSRVVRRGKEQIDHIDIGQYVYPPVNGVELWLGGGGMDGVEVIN